MYVGGDQSEAFPPAAMALPGLSNQIVHAYTAHCYCRVELYYYLKNTGNA